MATLEQKANKAVEAILRNSYKHVRFELRDETTAGYIQTYCHGLLSLAENAGTIGDFNVYAQNKETHILVTVFYQTSAKKKSTNWLKIQAEMK